ncbi:UNVERIFIED_CONTAM: hypothetical protein NCL1_29347 [Trichonephila clavipes]
MQISRKDKTVLKRRREFTVETPILEIQDSAAIFAEKISEGLYTFNITQARLSVSKIHPVSVSSEFLLWNDKA